MERHKVCHPHCVYNKLGYVYTCLTQLYGDIDMYNLLHKDQLHVSTSGLQIAHCKAYYIYYIIIVYKPNVQVHIPQLT